MDKFGIFKLLNSFLNLYSQKSSSNTNSSANAPQPNPLENLKDILKLNSSPTPSQADAQPKKEHIPLQANMLSTMRSHDEFVKRVKNGDKK